MKYNWIWVKIALKFVRRISTKIIHHWDNILEPETHQVIVWTTFGRINLNTQYTPVRQTI